MDHTAPLTLRASYHVRPEAFVLPQSLKRNVLWDPIAQVAHLMKAIVHLDTFVQIHHHESNVPSEATVQSDRSKSYRATSVFIVNPQNSRKSHVRLALMERPFTAQKAHLDR